MRLSSLNRLFPKAAVAAILLCAAARADERAVFPGREWQKADPGSVGMDEARLEEARKYALTGGGSGYITRHGRLVISWGDLRRRYDLKSTTKSIGMTAVGLAIKDGRLKLADKAAEHHPSFGTPPESNTGTGWLEEITLLHLATQTAGFAKRGGYEKLLFRPGTKWHYSDGGPNWLAECVTLNYHRDLRDLMFERVFTPLGITEKDLTWRNNAYRPHRIDGVPRREFGSGISANVDAMARIGCLYLRGGRWQDQQIIPRSFVKAASRPVKAVVGLPEHEPQHGNASDHYGLLWWNNADCTLKNVPRDAYWSWGLYDSLIVVIPSLDIVAARAGKSWERKKGARHYDVLAPFLEPIVASVRSTAKQRAAVADNVLVAKLRRGYIVVNPKNRRWLFRDDGRPLFLCGPGDPEDFLYRGRLLPDGTRRGDQRKLIEKLAGSGANCIYLMAVRSHGGDGNRTHNPFVDHDPANGLNNAVLDQWDEWFAEMDRHGIVILFFFYDDSARLWRTGDEVGEAERRFLEALVDRFEHHRNLIWCVAEEYQEALSAERVRRIAAVVRSADDHRHPIAVHKLSGLDFSEFADDPNIDQFAIQYNPQPVTPQALHKGMLSAWQKAQGRYNLNMSEVAHGAIGTGGTARRNMWAIALGGAYVMIHGMDISSTAQSDLEDCGRLARFFESTNFHEMSPHDELAHGGTQFVLARPGKSYILYAADAAGPLGLKQIKAGKYALRWLDCAGGRETRQHVKVPAGEATWKKPPGIGSEVAVYVRRLRSP